MPYPTKRKKKIPHQQYRALHRVLGQGFRLEHYTMLYDKGWWVCVEAENGELTFAGQSYDKLCRAKAYLGYQGERVVGYYRVVYRTHKAPAEVNYSCVKETFSAAVELHEAIKKHYTSHKRGWCSLGRPPLKDFEFGYYPGVRTIRPPIWYTPTQKKEQIILREAKFCAT